MYNNMKIVIDGNIGCGKSTQLDLLKNKGYDVHPERTWEWPLDEFYKNPQEYALKLQLSILESMYNKGNGIYERSPMSAYNVFWYLQSPTMEQSKEYDKRHTKLGWEPDIYIYIDKIPTLCYEHIKTRTQVGDSYISMEYLEKLHHRYDVLWDKVQCPKYRIDGSQTVDGIHNKICEILSDGRQVPENNSSRKKM